MQDIASCWATLWTALLCPEANMFLAGASWQVLATLDRCCLALAFSISYLFQPPGCAGGAAGN